MHLSLSRAISPLTIFHPDFVLLLPIAHGSYSCPGRLSLSKHWLQSKEAPQEKTQKLRGQVKLLTAVEASAEFFDQPLTYCCTAA